MNLRMTLHHQKRRGLPDGTHINIGEDGFPYADREVIIVADGLGGRGGYPHTKIDPRVLDEQLLISEFIAPVLGPADDGFDNFVKYSFKELFQLRERYSGGPSYMRTSGYFASRLVTAIVLHEMKFNPRFNRSKIFEEVKKSEGEEQKKYIDSVGADLTKIIFEKLTALANKMGLGLESKTTGSYLLPTTLVVALIDENESGVDVLYLWAGDSRGYLWNEDGLAQVTDDHERDETMTNLITLTKPFRLEARLLHCNKPVILFNATDGCYKCPCFASAFDLEYVLLHEIASASDFEAVQKNLDGQFTVIGTHDDSNTMGLMTYGFESFEEIKRAVDKRLADLKESIIDKLPGILERDYQDEMDQAKEKLTGSVYAVKDEMIANLDIAYFVKSKLKDDSSYLPYVNENSELLQKIIDLNTLKEKQEKKIEEWVSRYWLRKPCLKKIYANETSRWYDVFRDVADMEDKCAEEKLRYEADHSKILDDLGASVNAIMAMRSSILNLKALDDKDVASQLSRDIQKAQETLDDLRKRIVKGKNESKYSHYFKYNDKIDDLTKKYAKQDKERIQFAAKEIWDGDFKITPDLVMSDECRQEIEEHLRELYQITDDKEAVLADVGKLGDKHLPGYWKDNLLSLITLIQREHPEIIPEELKAKLAENMGDLQREVDVLSHCLEERAKLYEEYDKQYRRFFEESKL